MKKTFFTHREELVIMAQNSFGTWLQESTFKRYSHGVACFGDIANIEQFELVEYDNSNLAIIRNVEDKVLINKSDFIIKNGHDFFAIFNGVAQIPIYFGVDERNKPYMGGVKQIVQTKEGVKIMGVNNEEVSAEKKGGEIIITSTKDDAQICNCPACVARRGKA